MVVGSFSSASMWWRTAASQSPTLAACSPRWKELWTLHAEPASISTADIRHVHLRSEVARVIVRVSGIRVFPHVLR